MTSGIYFRKRKNGIIILLLAFILCAGCGRISSTASINHSNSMSSEAKNDRNSTQEQNEAEEVAEDQNVDDELATSDTVTGQQSNSGADSTNVETEQDAIQRQENCITRPNQIKTADKAYVDLDGNNSWEWISLNLEGTEFCIDDTIYPIDGDYYIYENVFSVVDINPGDSWMELTIEGNETSGSGVSTSFYRYKDNKLHFLGRVCCSLSNGDLSFDGINSMYENSHLITLHEDMVIERQFMLNEDERLEVVPPVEGYYNIKDSEQHICSLLVPLPVYEKMDHTQHSFELLPQKVTFSKTDADSWVEVIGEDGAKGWMYVEEPMMITDLGLPADQVFEGLRFLAP